MKKNKFNGTDLPKDWAKEFIRVSKGNRKIFAGIDFGYRYGWFDRLLIWLHLKKSEDFSCMVLAEQNKKGKIKILKVDFTR